MPGPGALSARMLESLLGADAAALDVLATPVCRAQPLSSFQALGAPRMAFRLELADGRHVKVRRAPDSDRAREIEQILAAATPGDFGRVLHRAGRVLIEEWVRGETPGDPPSPAHLREAGALLGRLHAIEHLGGRAVRQAVATTRDTRALHDDLDRLLQAGLIDAAVTGGIHEAAAHADPGITIVGVVHGDFCGENLVVTGGGRLCAIDNEDVRVDSLDGDVARTVQRWTLDGDQIDVLLDGYEHGRGTSSTVVPRAWRFWSLRVLASSAVFRHLSGDVDTARARVAAMRRAAGLAAC